MTSVFETDRSRNSLAWKRWKLCRMQPGRTSMARQVTTSIRLVATRLTLVLNILILFFVFILYNTGASKERFHVAYMITTIIVQAVVNAWLVCTAHGAVFTVFVYKKTDQVESKTWLIFVLSVIYWKKLSILLMFMNIMIFCCQ